MWANDLHGGQKLPAVGTKTTFSGFGPTGGSGSGPSGSGSGSGPCERSAVVRQEIQHRRMQTVKDPERQRDKQTTKTQRDRVTPVQERALAQVVWVPAPAQVVEARGRALAPAPGQAPANSAGREINKPAQTLICNDSKRWRDRDAERDKTTERGRHGGCATNNGSSEGTLTCTGTVGDAKQSEQGHTGPGPGSGSGCGSGPCEQCSA